MRKLLASIAAALAVAGVGLATDAATSDAPTDASVLLLPYLEQENLYKEVPFN
jgi:hypothetical protein